MMAEPIFCLMEAPAQLDSSSLRANILACLLTSSTISLSRADLSSGALAFFDASDQANFIF